MPVITAPVHGFYWCFGKVDSHIQANGIAMKGKMFICILLLKDFLPIQFLCSKIPLSIQSNKTFFDHIYNMIKVINASVDQASAKTGNPVCPLKSI
jgi:hypothetical protein